MGYHPLTSFEQRITDIIKRENDSRNAYERDKARIIHSAAFRRLQGKTQVMGTGESDFHRTRLTHSIEVGQIGEGLLISLINSTKENNDNLRKWLPNPALIMSACLAHDLGHPPFGHSGERALNRCMHNDGGFEGNAQTLRILTCLDVYDAQYGINPTRRTALSILKYPSKYSNFKKDIEKPPKCYYDEEDNYVQWLIKPFGESDKLKFQETINGKTKYKTFDASILDCADDIAYAVHDLEDIVGRELVSKELLLEKLYEILDDPNLSEAVRNNKFLKKDCISKRLFGGATDRKHIIGDLVNYFVTRIRIIHLEEFEHPLLNFQARLDDADNLLLKGIKGLTYDLVVKDARIQQLERRGERIIESLFNEFTNHYNDLVPEKAKKKLQTGATQKRNVSDYISGMTNSYAEKIYNRLFTPGFGSSHDEI